MVAILSIHTVLIRRTKRIPYLQITVLLAVNKSSYCWLLSNHDKNADVRVLHWCIYLHIFEYTFESIDEFLHDFVSLFQFIQTF